MAHLGAVTRDQVVPDFARKQHLQLHAEFPVLTLLAHEKRSYVVTEFIRQICEHSLDNETLSLRMNAQDRAVRWDLHERGVRLAQPDLSTEPMTDAAAD